MIRGAVAAAFVLACSNSRPPADPRPSASACRFPSTLDLGPERLSCLAARLHDRPDDVVDVIASLDWQRSKVRLLEALRRVPVASEEWYVVAQRVEYRQPRAALALLELASSSPNVGLHAELRVAQLRLAKQLGEGAAVDRARVDITGLAKEESVRLRLVNLLVSLDEQPLIATICDAGSDPAITWACAEADRGHLDNYLPAIAKLPVLDYDDAERLQRLRARERSPVLGGLDCLKRPSGMRSPNPSISGHTNEGHEVIIYYRLQVGKGWNYSDERRCLLRQAQNLCLRQIVMQQRCLLPFVFADDTTIQDDGMDGNWKNEMYRQLADQNRSGNAEAAVALLHLHLALAEALNSNRRDTGGDRPAFHVAQAFELWLQRPPTESFKSLLSQSLRQLVCTDVTNSSACGPMCGHNQRSTCFSTCKALVPKLIAACSS